MTVSSILACGGACHPEAKTGITLGGKTLDLSLLTSEKERRHGVSHLGAPGESRGYLLAWPSERFCMVDTEGSDVAFDVVFLDRSGTIVDVQPIKARNEEGVIPRSPAAFALLVAPGSAQKLGVKAGDKAQLSAQILAVKPEELPVIRINGVAASVELALTEPERQHGLMFRPRMSPDDGMLFAYADENERRFWMKNTMIPLDIAFFAADGTLLNVNETPMYPDPRNPGALYATSDSKGAARYVLEMNLGWFKRKGLTDGTGRFSPGTKAEIPPAATKGTYD
ncbi:MAG TPA: DUF192 domain-containing protein [Planctomycetota bacterium]|nr:DUF192 domain-containing protein [Planctomycetota bacterium]